MGNKNVCILPWNCANVKQCQPIIEKLVYSADVFVLMLALEIDMSLWDCNDVQVHAIRVQLPVPLMTANVCTCNGCTKMAKAF